MESQSVLRAAAPVTRSQRATSAASRPKTPAWTTLSAYANGGSCTGGRDWWETRKMSPAQATAGSPARHARPAEPPSATPAPGLSDPLPREGARVGATRADVLQRSRRRLRLGCREVNDAVLGGPPRAAGGIVARPLDQHLDLAADLGPERLGDDPALCRLEPLQPLDADVARHLEPVGRPADRKSVV